MGRAIAKALNEPAAANDLVLWYEKPASQWIDALPIGNGRLGAMVFGGCVTLVCVATAFWKAPELRRYGS